MQWQAIENAMHTIENQSGGFSAARRGIVTMPDGLRVFVKVVNATEDEQWVKKEIAVYKMLQAHNYPYVPKLLAHNDDLTGFALEALTAENGWDWTDTWNESRLTATLAAMDGLASLAPSDDEKKHLGVKGITKDVDGWRALQISERKQRILRQKLANTGRDDLANSLDFGERAKESAVYPFKYDTLVHHDIRADNCAWCPAEQTVKLIDWEWTQLGDRTIDQNAILAHVYKSSSYDVLAKYHDLLNTNALIWLAGFWLNASTNPDRPESPQVRKYQLASGIAALELASKL